MIYVISMLAPSPGEGLRTHWFAGIDPANGFPTWTTENHHAVRIIHRQSAEVWRYAIAAERFEPIQNIEIGEVLA